MGEQKRSRQVGGAIWRAVTELHDLLSPDCNLMVRPVCYSRSRELTQTFLMVYYGILTLLMDRIAFHTSIVIT